MLSSKADKLYKAVLIFALNLKLEKTQCFEVSVDIGDATRGKRSNEDYNLSENNGYISLIGFSALLDKLLKTMGSIQVLILSKLSYFRFMIRCSKENQATSV